MAEFKRAFVCGHPISHSRSPMIHRHWLATLGIAGTYDPIDVAPAEFAAFATGLRAAGLTGGNVTIPHKEAAFALVARRDAAAEAIGAVNTLWLEGDALCGGNTDADGFSANIDAALPAWRDAGVATVLGAGGASRAVVHALDRAGFDQIRIVNRTFARAESLAAMSPDKARALPWEQRQDALAGAGLVVNTTSLGMAGQDPLDLDLDRLPDSAIVTDIVYVPLVTPILAAAAARGLRTVDGLGMLLHQAAPGFERWFGVRPKVTPELRALVVADLEAGH